MNDQGLTREPAAVLLLKTVVAVLVIALLTLASVRRNAAWHSLLSLWTDCAAKSPQKSRTRNNLGNCNLLLRRYFPAIAEYQKAVELDPTNMEAQYNLATTLDTVGLAAQAMRPYGIFCRTAPPGYAEQSAHACGRLRELEAYARTGTKP